MTAPLQAKSLSLKLVLSSQPLQIPDFQREYSWGEDQLADFWDDVLDSASRGNHHFFGTLLTAPAGNHPQEERLDVLDGQQRLTTFTLLLVALHRELEELLDPSASRRVRTDASEARRLIEEVLQMPDGERRLKLRSEDDPAMANLLAGNSVKGSLGEAFNTLHSTLRAHLKKSENISADLRSLLEAILHRCVVIHAHCTNGFDPFVVFSTLNATGLPLTSAQILRARSLGLVNGLAASTASEATKAWAAVEALKESADSFVWTYMVLRTGARPKDLVRDFDKIALESKALPKAPPQREAHFDRLHGEIRELVPLFQELSKGRWPKEHQPPESKWHENRLRLLVKELGLKQIVPTLLAIARSAPKEFSGALQLLEHASICALLAFDNQTQWGNKLFALAKGFRDGDLSDREQLRIALAEFFTKQLGNPRTVLERRIPVVLQYNGHRRRVLRYFLTTLNDWGYPAGSPTAKPDTQAVFQLREIHIDHVCPKNGLGKIAQIDRDRLGNLTPLWGRKNTALQAKPFHEKLAVYAESPLRMTRELAREKDFTHKELDKREEAMIKFAAALFTRDIESQG